jgi:hypothetical protein
MASIIIIDADDFIEPDRDLPHEERQANYHANLDDFEECERAVVKAIERARYLVGGCGGDGHITTGGGGNAFYNVVVTSRGSLMAMVRWNLDAMTEEDPSAVEVLRFKEGLVPY